MSPLGCEGNHDSLLAGSIGILIFYFIFFFGGGGDCVVLMGGLGLLCNFLGGWKPGLGFCRPAAGLPKMDWWNDICFLFVCCKSLSLRSDFWSTHLLGFLGNSNVLNTQQCERFQKSPLISVGVKRQTQVGGVALAAATGSTRTLSDGVSSVGPG